MLYQETIATLPTSVRDITILVSKGADAPAEPEFRGRVVAFDGYLDLAVVQITETFNGRIIAAGEDLGLPAVPIGDSAPSTRTTRSR